MDLNDQEELIFYLKNEPENGFELLYELYGKKVFNIAYKILGNREEAKDITQETFIQVYKSINSFKGNSHIFTWIYTITKNMSFRSQQKNKRSSITELEKLINNVSSNLDNTEFSKIEKQYYIEQVKEGCLLGLLCCLSFYQRTAFIFNILLNIPIKEVSIILNKTESAIRTLIHRARLNIKEFLCQNCSIYEKNNKCKCENLINFSLKKGWIQKYQSHQSDAEIDIFIHKIEGEINNLKKITLIYQSISEHDLPSDFIQTIQKSILQQKFLIFSPSKVK